MYDNNVQSFAYIYFGKRIRVFRVNKIVFFLTTLLLNKKLCPKTAKLATIFEQFNMLDIGRAYV